MVLMRSIFTIIAVLLACACSGGSGERCKVDFEIGGHGGGAGAGTRQTPNYVGTSVPGATVQWYIEEEGPPTVVITGRPPSGFANLLIDSPSAGWATATAGEAMPADLQASYLAAGKRLGVPTVIQFEPEPAPAGDGYCIYDWYDAIVWDCQHQPQINPYGWCDEHNGMRDDTTPNVSNQWAGSFFKSTYLASLCQRNGNGQLDLYKYNTVTGRNSYYRRYYTEAMHDENLPFQVQTVIKGDYHIAGGDIRWWAAARMAPNSAQGPGWSEGDVVFYGHMDEW